MKVAVTGAAGFIGRHVLKALADQGCETVAIVRPGATAAIDAPYAHLVQADVHNPQEGLFKKIMQPDALIHLAWGGLPNYQALAHFEHELPAQYLFLKTLILEGLDNLLVTGTCLEYGMQCGELSEDMEARPTTPYGFAKDTLRRQLEFLGIANSFRLTWARLFYLYGEGQSENSLFSQLNRAVQRGDSVFNMSGGEQLRDYLNVESVAAQLTGLTLRSPGAGVVNVCSGHPISVGRLVTDWINAKGWQIDLKKGVYPYPAYEPMAFWGSRRKLDFLSAGNPDEKGE